MNSQAMDQNQRQSDNADHPDDDALNPYAAIITREARRRGIRVTILDPAESYFSLSFADRAIVCRESLSELTNAIAMSRCDDKAVSARLLAASGLRVPAQLTVTDTEKSVAFLNKYQHIVVKPAHGEQGAGISVDITNTNDMNDAIKDARQISRKVLLEEYIHGEDLRVVVINDEVVAAAVRRPPLIIGDGVKSIEELIQIQSEKRKQATGGESHIPLDNETRHCIRDAGYMLSSILPTGEILIVHKTSNLHAGATIEDVTAHVHDKVREAALRAAQIINIPVVGIDFIVPAVDSAEYVFIEANERPGLANHEPQPTAQRFIDFLFPETTGM
jgi:GNAT-family acetyltransferase (TIGR03103 family)